MIFTGKVIVSVGRYQVCVLYMAIRMSDFSDTKREVVI